MSGGPAAPRLHPSAEPAAQRGALHAALRGGRLPGALLYRSPEQARRWLDYHQAWSPSRGDADVRALYAQAFRAAAQLVSGAVLVLGLGSGGGHKDAELLAALARDEGRPAPHYVPVDASPALADEAAHHVRAQFPAVVVRPLVADLASAPTLEPWLAAADAAELPRVVSCFGMLPNQHPRDFPAWLARLLRPGDALLLSANLSPGGLAADGARIAVQYDNPPARRWYEGALAELGLDPARLELEVRPEPLADAPAGLGPTDAWRIAVRAHLPRAVALELDGARVAWPAGTALEVFHSLRFSVAGVEALLRSVGLAPRECWIGAGGEEGVFLCARL